MPTTYNKTAPRQGPFIAEQVIAPVRGAACGNMEEIWKPFPDFEDSHMISNMGRVKSVHRAVLGRGWKPRQIKERILKPSPKKSGYVRIKLKDGGKTVMVHSAVLRAFIGECPANHQACHNDGCRHNNHVSNLRWDTPLNNCMDKYLHGTIARGERHGNSKLTKDDIKAIRASTDARMDVAKKYDIHPDTVWKIRSKQSWAWVM